MGLARGTQTYQHFWALADHHAEDGMEVFILIPSRERTGTVRPLPPSQGDISVCFRGFENKQRGSIPSQLPAPPHAGLQESVGTRPLQGPTAGRERICQTCHTVAFTVLKTSSVLAVANRGTEAELHHLHTQTPDLRYVRDGQGRGLLTTLLFQLPFSHPLLKLQTATPHECFPNINL